MFLDNLSKCLDLCVKSINFLLIQQANVVIHTELLLIYRRQNEKLKECEEFYTKKSVSGKNRFGSSPTE